MWTCTHLFRRYLLVLSLDHKISAALLLTHTSTFLSFETSSFLYSNVDSDQRWKGVCVHSVTFHFLLHVKDFTFFTCSTLSLLFTVAPLVLWLSTQDSISCYLLSRCRICITLRLACFISFSCLCALQITSKPENCVFFLNANACTIVKHLKWLLPIASSDRNRCKPQRPLIWPREQMLRLLHVPLLPPLQPHPSCTEARPSQVIRSSKAGGVGEGRWLSPPSTQALAAEDGLFTSAGRMPAGVKAL